MAEPELANEPAVPPEVTGETDEQPVRLAWLRRLNERGFRLVMLLDALGLGAVVLITMVVRFGLDWPTYPVPLYLTSFLIVVAIFVAGMYFGGLYEREPRLGAPPALPRAARQTLGAGGLVALLNLASTGAARELGLATERALPFPIPNLVVLIVVGAVVVATNRRLVQVVRTHREGPPKVVVAGTASALSSALEHLEADGARATITARVDDVGDLCETVDRTGATDVLVLTSEHLDRLYPTVLAELERRRVTVLLRVSAKETMYGLERIREIGGLPFVLLRSQTMPVSRTRFKRVFDLFVLAVGAVAWVPLLAVIGLYQLVVAGRPLLYRQARVGAGGQPFSTWSRDRPSGATGGRSASR
jgi:hypothetical protein